MWGDGGHQISEERRVKSEEGLARRPKGKSMQVTFSNQRPRKETGDRCWVLGVGCWVLAVTRVRKKSPYAGRFRGSSLLRFSFASPPLQVPFQNGR